MARRRPRYTLPPEPDSRREYAAFLCVLVALVCTVGIAGLLLLYGSPLVEGPR